MSRNKSEHKKPLWKKISRGTLVIRNPRYHRIKFKESVYIEHELIEKNISEFELLENGTGPYKVDLEEIKELPANDAAELPEGPEKDSFEVKSVGGGWFDVLSASGEKMNDKKLRKEPAAKLVEELESIGDE
jgi:hypothetical protein